ncbi:branched-chain amino acid transaminase [Mangrovivirga cuniculi]|uniref:Branched-chain-amino-acid aminotransferase n=1 Tax=Mangrovivirga cuniculi TaxID=2715131 RepID=A0A4D7K1C6_9BACT|nr:branched-chain amino acid transaminase [Mangrovivirga cuniculi]QCK16735.1 branched-chain amino acid aminotransferase [Mangrovivirga cuniculi]
MYFSKKSIVLFDGEWRKAEDAEVSLYNQTMHYGLGVFEGMRAYKTDEGAKIFKPNRHFDRLINSAKKHHLNFPFTSLELTELAYELLKKNKLKNAYIRPLIYAGPYMGLRTAPAAHFLMAAWEWNNYLGEEPLNVNISKYEKLNPAGAHIESKVVGNYVNSILASNDARDKGYDEALMLDMNGYIAQGPAANFFYEKDEVLYTPKKGYIMPGITRQTIIDLANETGFKIVEKDIRPEEILDADSAFFTGTAIEVTGIKSIEGRKMRIPWKESIGYSLFLMYRRKVTKDHLTAFNLV